MRIGLIGWYGHSNAGDERILYCLSRLFQGDELTVTRGFEDAQNRLVELNACDYVLLGGGGMILRGFGKFAHLLEKLKPPFGCIGLGVEAKHADNQALLDVLKRKAEFILVRDTASRDRLDGHFKVIVGPDLTFLYPYDVADWCEHDRCGINLRPWPYWHFEHGGWTSHVMHRLNQKWPSLKTLYPLRKWDPGRTIQRLRRRFAELVPLALYGEPDCVTDREVLGRYFVVSDDGFFPERLAGCRYLVGMRLHSLIFACQMAIPFVSLSYQPKNWALCEDIGMDALSVDLYHARRFKQAVTTMKERAHELRQHLLQIREEKRREAWQVIEPIVCLVRQKKSSPAPSCSPQ